MALQEPQEQVPPPDSASDIKFGVATLTVTLALGFVWADALSSITV